MAKCPECGGNNFKSEGVYFDGYGETGAVIVYCDSCGHIIGVVPVGKALKD